jgi:hypothetical protein
MKLLLFGALKFGKLLPAVAMRAGLKTRRF